MARPLSSDQRLHLAQALQEARLQAARSQRMFQLQLEDASHLWFLQVRVLCLTLLQRPQVMYYVYPRYPTQGLVARLRQQHRFQFQLPSSFHRIHR